MARGTQILTRALTSETRSAARPPRSSLGGVRGSPSSPLVLHPAPKGEDGDGLEFGFDAFVSRAEDTATPVPRKSRSDCPWFRVLPRGSACRRALQSSRRCGPRRMGGQQRADLSPMNTSDARRVRNFSSGCGEARPPAALLLEMVLDSIRSSAPPSIRSEIPAVEGRGRRRAFVGVAGFASRPEEKQRVCQR